MATLAEVNEQLAKLEEQLRALRQQQEEAKIAGIEQARTELAEYDKKAATARVEFLKSLGYAEGDLNPSREVGRGRRGLRAKAGIVSSTAKPKAAAKYANPENPSETWSGGRGRKPRWVQEWIAAGKDIAQAAIK